MKKIKLPSTQVYTMSLDMKHATVDQIQEVDGHKIVHIGTIDFAQTKPEIEAILENGAQIVYATISIEAQLDDLLVNFFFRPVKGRNHPRDFFRQNVLQSASLDYSLKKQLVQKIINYNKLLEGKRKNKLQSNLKSIMVWRNAFAHGHIEYDARKGPLLKYFSGGAKDLRLDDDYWDSVEKCFKEAEKLLKSATDNLTKQKGEAEKD